MIVDLIISLQFMNSGLFDLMVNILLLLFKVAVEFPSSLYRYVKFIEVFEFPTYLITMFCPYNKQCIILSKNIAIEKNFFLNDILDYLFIRNIVDFFERTT